MAPKKAEPSQSPQPDFAPPNTLFSPNSVWVSGSFLFAIASAAWVIAQQVSGIKNDLGVLKQQMWSRNEQRQFANELQSGNIDLTHPLKVPDTDQISARFKP